MFGILGGLVRTRKAKEFIGKVGEKRVNRVLDLHNFGYAFTNYICLDKHGKSHQIDTILVNKCGVFVIETKNLVGIIKGNDTDPYWIQMTNRSKRKYYSPVKQNQTHCNLIKSIVPDYVKITSLIVMAKNNASRIDSKYTINLCELSDFLSNQKEILDDSQVQKVIELIKSNQDTSITNEEHANSVNKRLNRR